MNSWPVKDPAPSSVIITGKPGVAMDPAGHYIYALDISTTGLPKLDAGNYEKGRKVSDEEFAAVNLTPSRFHGEWNYVIRPND